jgi:hypothetical protein
MVIALAVSCYTALQKRKSFREYDKSRSDFVPCSMSHTVVCMPARTQGCTVVKSSRTSLPAVHYHATMTDLSRIVQLRKCLRDSTVTLAVRH